MPKQPTIAFQQGEFPLHEAERAIFPHLHTGGWKHGGLNYIWYEGKQLPKGWYIAEELVKFKNDNPA